VRRALVIASVWLAGCFYVEPINQRPSIDIRAPGTPIFRGDMVTIAAGNGGVMVDGAKVVKTDIAATNGVIHVIDTVIMPKDM